MRYMTRLLEKHLSLFSNPAGNSVFIELNKNDIILQIHIYNSLGQEQQVEINTNVDKHSIELNTAYLRAGIYSIVVFTDKGTRAGIFVKN